MEVKITQNRKKDGDDDLDWSSQKIAASASRLFCSLILKQVADNPLWILKLQSSLAADRLNLKISEPRANV